MDTWKFYSKSLHRNFITIHSVVMSGICVPPASGPLLKVWFVQRPAPVLNQLPVSISADHKEAPGASFHVSPNSHRSLTHMLPVHLGLIVTHVMQLLKKTLGPPPPPDPFASVSALRAVLMVRWLKAVLMHHTSYLASVSALHTFHIHTLLP